MAYELDIHYIDVGQGDCTLIVIRDEERMPDNEAPFDTRIVQTIVIDCGTNGRKSTVQNAQNQNYDPAEAAVPWYALLNKLQELKVEKIDKIIVTHYDKDHYNGIIFGFEMYAAARAKSNPSTQDILIMQLLENVRIYDQGMVLYLSNTAFVSEPPLYVTFANNTNEAPDFNEYRNMLAAAQAFKNNSENITSNTGFDSVEHTQLQDEDRFKHFSGRDNFIYYIQLAFRNGLARETERVMVGHPMQWNANNPYLFNLNVTPKNNNDDDSFHDEEIYIQSKFWESTVSDGHYKAKKLHYWGYRQFLGHASDRLGRNKAKVYRFTPREVNVDGYRVKRLSPIHLLGQNLLEEFDSPEQPIQLTCIAANGFVWDTNNEPLRAFDDTGDDNSFSLGFVLKFGNLVHWFGGDLEIRQEDACIPTIQSMIGDSGIFVMKASHHGSETSSSENFLKQLKPRAVFISAGVRYGHPHVTTLHRFEQSKSIKHVFMTGTDNFKKMRKKGDLPKDFPVFSSIYHRNSRFMIAGSLNHSGNIVLKCTSEDSQNGIFQTNFTNQNAYMIVDEPMPLSVREAPVNPIVTLNRSDQYILVNENHPAENFFISNQKRFRRNDQKVLFEQGLLIRKKPRVHSGRIFPDMASFIIKKTDLNENE